MNQTTRATATPAANPPIPNAIHGRADNRLMMVDDWLGDPGRWTVVEERCDAKLIVRAMFLVIDTETGTRQKFVRQGTCARIVVGAVF